MAKEKQAYFEKIAQQWFAKWRRIDGAVLTMDDLTSDRSATQPLVECVNELDMRIQKLEDLAKRSIR
jgi:hypothetical protein